MKTYNCEYRDGHKLNIGDNWKKKGILASNHKEAYEKFIQEVGLYPKSVTVSSGLLGVWKEFDKHLEETNTNVMESAILNLAIDTKIDGPSQTGWATFLNICGVLNLILFVIGGIWMLEARSSEQFAAMNLTIIGLVAAINCFFFSFLVNIFTRIQHNTHQTTILLSKLIDKTESKD
jgi:hypothetical protein